MANKLKIIKRSDKGFVHRHNDLVATDYSISDFEVSFDGGKFKIVENDGSTRFPYDVTDITVVDLTTGGIPKTFVTFQALEDELRDILYTPYVGSSSTDVITNLKAYHGIFSGTIGQTNFTIPENCIVIKVFVDKYPYEYGNTLTGYTVSGTNMILNTPSIENAYVEIDGLIPNT